MNRLYQSLIYLTLATTLTGCGLNQAYTNFREENPAIKPLSEDHWIAGVKPTKKLEPGAQDLTRSR